MLSVLLYLGFGIGSCSSHDCPQIPTNPGDLASHNDRCCVVITCEAGYRPKKVNQTTECIPCPEGEFMANSSESYLMRVCSRHGLCKSPDQKTIGGGNTTHDYVCGCNNELGYFKDSSKPGHCIKVCPAGQQLNDSGMCEPCQEGYFKSDRESLCKPCLDCDHAILNTSSLCNTTHDSICSHVTNVTEVKMADSSPNNLYFLFFLVIDLVVVLAVVYIFKNRLFSCFMPARQLGSRRRALRTSFEDDANTSVQIYNRIRDALTQ